MLIYENTVKSKGNSVTEFGDTMLITFGDSAPDALKDYCYGIDAKPTNGTIKVGQYLDIDGHRYEILVVGDIAEKNLVELGHVTVNFTGDSEGLPGALVVENKPAPTINVGSVIKIEE